jgi:hypothetical protein
MVSGIAWTCRLMLVMHTTSESTIVMLPIPDLTSASAHQLPTPPRPKTITRVAASFSRTGAPTSSSSRWRDGEWERGGVIKRASGPVSVLEIGWGEVQENRRFEHLTSSRLFVCNRHTGVGRYPGPEFQSAGIKKINRRSKVHKHEYSISYRTGISFFT